MKKYIKPNIEINLLEIEDIILRSLTGEKADAEKAWTEFWNQNEGI